MASALFLRGFDREILEEMRGIAEGASDAGAKWQDRRIDLLDIVVANVTVEIGELHSAVRVTPTGLENFTFSKPAYTDKLAVTERCSAFAATGPATRDGKMVIGHVTWWPLTLAEQTNVMLDIKPANGHRLLMQSYPGGIESGTDWYQNDAGLVLTETTISQTPFNAEGTPVAFRARQAIQYGASIDDMVKHLGTRNNGLYTNEWLMGDGKTNEIAMYELGTTHTQAVAQLEERMVPRHARLLLGQQQRQGPRRPPGDDARPARRARVPALRARRPRPRLARLLPQIQRPDRRAVRLRSFPHGAAGRRQHHGREGPDRRHGEPPDGVGRDRPPEPARVAAVRRYGYAGNDGLYPSGYHLFEAPAAAPESTAVKTPASRDSTFPASPKSRLWKGWVLPATESDTWLVAGAAAYHRILAAPGLGKQLEAVKINYRGLKLGRRTR